MNNINYSAKSAITEIITTVKSISHQTSTNDLKEPTEIINDSYFLDYINELLQTINPDKYDEMERNNIYSICDKILNSTTK